MNKIIDAAGKALVVSFGVSEYCDAIVAAGRGWEVLCQYNNYGEGVLEVILGSLMVLYLIYKGVDILNFYLEGRIQRIQKRKRNEKKKNY